MTTVVNDTLAHALAYAGLGWRVMPILPGKKKPRLDEWPTAATTDPDLIAQWWTNWPDHGIGLVCGSESGFFALDVDPRHSGDEVLRDYEQANTSLPETVQAITGGGGSHYLWAWPALEPGQTIGNSAGKIGSGLDVKSTGGYIVVAPSIHPDTASRYEWESSHLPGQVPVAPAPQWLLDLVIETTESVPEGQVEQGHDLTYARDRYDFGPGWQATATALLQSCGWHSPRTDRRGVTYLVRPGKTTYEGQGASIGKIPGVTYIWTDGAAPLTPGGYRNHELYTLLEHAGDPLAADKALVSLTGGWRTVIDAQEGKAMVTEVNAIAKAKARGEGPGSHYTPGGEFIFGYPDTIPPLWGDGEDILWAEGEPLLIVGPPGVGKTTIAGQLLAGRLGFIDELLALPIATGNAKTLYLASDRPRQIARSLRRTFAEDDRPLIDERLVVWQGPPPEDLAVNTDLIVQMAGEAGADTVFLDSLKDMAVGLNDDATAAGLNRAIQKASRAGIEVVILHHQRKAQNGQKPKTLADVYGSTWITAGVGSVVLLWGDAGDGVVELVHLKQPAATVGPLKVEHDHARGTSQLHADTFSLLGYVQGGRSQGRDTTDCARAMHKLSSTTVPTPAQVKRARDRLERLVAQGKVAKAPAGKGGAGGSGAARWLAVGLPSAPWEG